jgi:carbon monoxide dehydrogenase subunit G
MEFTGRYSIPATPQAVWDALHDDTVLAKSIPGCEEVRKLSDSEFEARAMVRIGPVQARFEGRVQITPLAPEPGFSHALTLRAEGKGGAAGFARGESHVRISADGNGGATLEYAAKAVVGGRLAQLGQRLIDGAAKSLADEFFTKFTAATTAEHAGLVADAAPPPRQEGLPPAVWVAALIAIIISLLIVFSRLL